MSRLDRVAALLRNEVASILQHKVDDRRVGFISVLGVKVSKDLEDAWIYYSQIGDEDAKQETKRRLYQATPFVYAELCKAIPHMKRIPKIHFKFDDSLEKGVQLINRINQLDEE